MDQWIHYSYRCRSWDSYNYTAHYYPLYIYIEYTSIGLSLFPLPQWLSILLHSNTYWYSMVIGHRDWRYNAVPPGPYGCSSTGVIEG